MMRRAALGLTAALLMAGASTAHAKKPPISANVCLESNDKAQRLRADHKLREAREQLLVCSQSGCPKAVQRDCAQWLSEVDVAMPTLSFVVKDEQGRDLTDVSISVDGEPLLEQLDGSAIAIDPGKHVFVFRVADAPPITEELLVNEGDKSRQLAVRFAPAVRSAPTPPPPPRRRSPLVLPVAVGAGGAVVLLGGLVFMANRNASIPDECKVEPGVCKNTTAGDPKLQHAADLKNQANAGLGVALGGGAVLAGALGWLVYEIMHDAPDSRRATRHVEPVVGLGHLGVRGSF